MTRVLVIGAGGFVGGHVAAQLAATPGCEVVRATREAAGAITEPTTHADLADAVQVAALLRQWPAEVIVHAAGRAEGAADEIVRDNQAAGLTLINTVPGNP